MDFDQYMSRPDFLMDFKLEPMDYELCKIAATEEDLEICREELENFEMKNVDAGLSSPLNVWLPCPGLAGDDLDIDLEVKSEVEEEQISFDWPRMESDWLIREVRGSDWLPPAREPDWQQQRFVDPPLPEERRNTKLLSPHTHELLSQMKPCSVQLDSAAIPKYLADKDLQFKTKIKQLASRKTVQKRKKKQTATITFPIQFKSIPSNTFLNLRYLEKSNPDFIYTDFTKSKRSYKSKIQITNGNQSDGVTDNSSRSSNDSESVSTLLYQCPYCLSLFFTEFEFRYHVSQKLSNNSRMYCIDTIPSVYECVDCLQVFESHHTFNKHMNYQHSTSVSCEVCQEPFTYVCQLNKHQHTYLHFHTTNIKCKLCDMEFPNNYCLDSHNYYWHESSYQCQICGTCFQNATKLTCHMYVLHGSSTKSVSIVFPQNIPHITTELVKSNPVSILLPQNTTQIITDQVKLATFNPTSILFVPNLTQPISNQLKIEPLLNQNASSSCDENSSCWPCEKCNKNYKLVENFMAHWKKKHSSDPLPSWFSQLIFCATPDKARELFVRDLGIPEETKNETMMDDAKINVHKNIEPTPILKSSHVCPKCEKVYKNAVTLKKHITFEHEYEDLLNGSDENTDSITCSLCPTTLLNDTYLHAHMISKHPQHVKYKCSDCNLTFETSNLYSRHFRVVHKIDKMFQCKVCSASYTSSYYLSMHVLRHHNQRMVHCPHCKHDHPFSSYLQRHLGKCAPDLAFHMCPLCSAIFEEPKQAKVHIVEQHLKKCKKILHCDICINAFFTKCNLTVHMKNRHFKKSKMDYLNLI